jgi:hypothetical protein
MAMSVTVNEYLASGLILLTVGIPHAKEVRSEDAGSPSSSIESAHHHQIECVRAPLQVVALQLNVESTSNRA